MEGFIAIVSVIFGILSLILFFKIWGACDNIAEIKRLMSQGNTQKSDTSISIQRNNQVSQSQNIFESAVESPLALRIAELEATLSDISSEDDKYSRLNKFLNREYKNLKKYTLKGNESQANATWKLILEKVEPLYKSINKTIPWAFEQYR
ncbi:MAG: hypothetical protein HDS16_05190 [Bacteroides sp.]|nr:hypothetical protein [Bacteroides sp.]